MGWMGQTRRAASHSSAYPPIGALLRGQASILKACSCPNWKWRETGGLPRAPQGQPLITAATATPCLHPQYAASSASSAFPPGPRMNDPPPKTRARAASILSPDLLVLGPEVQGAGSRSVQSYSGLCWQRVTGCKTLANPQRNGSGPRPVAFGLSPERFRRERNRKISSGQGVTVAGGVRGRPRGPRRGQGWCGPSGGCLG
jgi:hypothetical protein